MPLGGFFGGGSNGPKPQPLQNENKKEKREKGSTSNKDFDKEYKGMAIKVNKKSYTIDKKLGEGGFAVVFLVVDKHNRYYAMKKQLIKDDPRQLEACKVEAQIVKNLSGHKNIIGYIDHQLTLNKQGVYDSVLLCVYYKNSVLQLMNNRLLANKWLTVNEILHIFCDMCEAVARLHHSRTPVYHRDLKLENILIDERPNCDRPTYVLCDFGSATTKVLTRGNYSIEQIENEIARYTTLSYRAPEMIDLFSDVPIDTKSDIWALGIMLYKLCYFTLPFGESALAIQNGNLTFPVDPPIPEEIKAIISFLLTPSAFHRPNIFQTSYLAFSAANQKCPVLNIHKSPRIELLEAVKIFRMREKLGANYSKALEKAMNEAYVAARNSSTQVIKSNHKEEFEDKTDNRMNNYSNNPFLQQNIDDISNEQKFVDTHLYNNPTTTTVNPRLRPKPAMKINMNQSLANNFSAPLVANTNQKSNTTTTSVTTASDESITTNIQSLSIKSEWDRHASKINNESYTLNQSKENEQHSTEKDNKIIYSMKVQQLCYPKTTTTNTSSITTGVTTITTSSATTIPAGPRSSAFKPYSATNRNHTQIDKQKIKTNMFSDYLANKTESSGIMDDQVFGERFDELPRVVRKNTTKTESFQYNPKIIHLIMNDEPFAKAPFDDAQIYEFKR